MDKQTTLNTLKIGDRLLNNDKTHFDGIVIAVCGEIVAVYFDGQNKSRYSFNKGADFCEQVNWYKTDDLLRFYTKV